MMRYPGVGSFRPILTLVSGFAIYFGYITPELLGQSSSLQPPTIIATAKGPNQINLSWSPAANAGYGYLVEIQSASDTRYSLWTELKPVPAAGGYVCSSTVVLNGAVCTTSDPTGIHVYTPPTNSVPSWVAESGYIDPQDGSHVQFIAAGLAPDTDYTFRVRTYSGNTNPTFSSYSNTGKARTLNYARRYVSPAGSDSNNGTAADASHAWRTLMYASKTIACGQELIVLGGNYQHDEINLTQLCSPLRKVVVMADPGDTAMIQSPPAGIDQTIALAGSSLVVDGIKSIAEGKNPGEYVVLVTGNYNALFNVEVSPDIIPVTSNGVVVYGGHNLLYGSYLHDFGSPEAAQNPDGGAGWILALLGPAAVNNVIWSNHLTRGGHDQSLCKSGCSYNRWLNNIVDGGWGQAWATVFGDNTLSQHNLFEGNVVKDIGQLEQAYKPAIQLSQSFSTVRRNVVVNTKSRALEVSALYSSTASNNLVYNNVFYKQDTCLFQSSSSGVTAYDGDIFVNNICYPITNLATDIYLPNSTNVITNNDLLAVNANGAPVPNQPIVTWNHAAQGAFQYPKALAYADGKYSPPFANNKGLDVNPSFVDESNMDFHLRSGSALLGAGAALNDSDWGSPTGSPDLGAFGIAARTQSAADATPGPVVASLVNGASYLPGAVAPGENVVAVGTSLGPPFLTGGSVAPDGKVAGSVSDTQLLFDGISAPILYAWGQQTSAVVPYEVAGKATTTVQLVYQGVQSDAVTYDVAQAAPGIYTQDGDGMGAGAVVNADGITINSPQTPAQKGSVVAVYMTGGGITAPATVTGALIPADGSVLPLLASQVTCTVGGIPATVRYAGSAPGLISGVIQVNVKIPSQAPSGAEVPLVISVESPGDSFSSSSQAGVTIAIQ
ncbi:MAG TPA: hypothetical protein VG096_00200 [Bryobacteraceae bacterium]|nr:hypothetical protein [Bryobacteraceae bacterium]